MIASMLGDNKLKKVRRKQGEQLTVTAVIHMEYDGGLGEDIVALCELKQTNKRADWGMKQSVSEDQRHVGWGLKGEERKNQE